VSSPAFVTPVEEGKVGRKERESVRKEFKKENSKRSMAQRV
jgi:hypothetical protein